MASDNPVSPKVIAGGIGAALLPGLTAAGLALVSFFLDPGNQSLFPSIPVWVWQVLAVVGAVVAGYLKKDPLRVPTVEQRALDNINE
jgi:hypothetical protein